METVLSNHHSDLPNWINLVTELDLFTFYLSFLLCSLSLFCLILKSHLHDTILLLASISSYFFCHLFTLTNAFWYLIHFGCAVDLESLVQSCAGKTRFGFEGLWDLFGKTTSKGDLKRSYEITRQEVWAGQTLWVWQKGSERRCCVVDEAGEQAMPREPKGCGSGWQDSYLKVTVKCWTIRSKRMTPFWSDTKLCHV